jgi:hypothetical protein
MYLINADSLNTLFKKYLRHYIFTVIHGKNIK